MPGNVAIRRLVGRFGLAVAIVFLRTATLHAQEGMLQTIRSDVREGPPHGPPEPPPPAPPPVHASDTYRENGSSWDDGITLDAAIGIGLVAGAIVTAPVWVPHNLLQDDFAVSGYFTRFPYETPAGYMVLHNQTPGTRTCAGRLDIEWIETFNRLDNLGGHLLLSTTSRFGLAGSLGRLDERLPGGGRDDLLLGDCNIVYRFAQNEWAEFRAGAGLNWMHDAAGTASGFNFTYGADFFPRRPWVFSSELDWGRLGHAELFRFRATAGIIFHGIEAYTGYEYTDIQRTRWNGLIGGVRVWF